MNIKEITDKLRLVLDDLSKASNSSSEEAFDICQGLEYSEVLLSDMIENLEPHGTIATRRDQERSREIGGFTHEDIRDHLESEDIIFISDELFENFAQHLEDKFDANIGLSWELIVTNFEVWDSKNKKK